jgi:hypothetical protein
MAGVVEAAGSACRVDAWFGTAAMVTFDYDTARWPLRECMVAALGVEQLEKLHEHVESQPGRNIAERSIELSNMLRSTLTPEFLALIREFMHNALPSPFTVTRYQQSPVMRVHLHGGHSVSGMHRDRDWGQRSSVFNLWLPFTAVWDSNSIWVESEEGSQTMTPVALMYGQAMIFRGADLLHGSKRNTTGSTRVSCDIRFHVR